MWRLRKIHIMPTVRQIVFVENDFDSWDPKIHDYHNYFQSFYVAAIIEECGTNKHYPLAMF